MEACASCTAHSLRAGHQRAAPRSVDGNSDIEIMMQTPTTTLALQKALWRVSLQCRWVSWYLWSEIKAVLTFQA